MHEMPGGTWGGTCLLLREGLDGAVEDHAGYAGLGREVEESEGKLRDHWDAMSGIIERALCVRQGCQHAGYQAWCGALRHASIAQSPPDWVDS